jgi:hypothetical protein
MKIIPAIITFSLLRFSCVIGVLLLVAHPNYAQTTPITFDETHPSANTDSLEKWLTQHPAHTRQRLVNLLKLERSYWWNYHDDRYKRLPEIAQLATQLRSQSGLAIYHYLEATSFRERNSFYKSHAIAEAFFEANRDSAGIVAIKINECGFLGHFRLKLSRQQDQANIDWIKRYFQQPRNPHQTISYMLFWSINLDNIQDQSKFERKLINQAYQLIKENPVLNYARFRLAYREAESFDNDDDDCAIRYRKLYQLKDQLPPNGHYFKAVIEASLGYDCVEKNRSYGGIKHYQAALDYLKKSRRTDNNLSNLIYYNCRIDFAEIGEYKKANEYADSAAKYLELVSNTEAEIKAAELSKIYDLSIKEKEVKSLESEQQRLYIYLFIGTILLSFLIYAVFSL